MKADTVSAVSVLITKTKQALLKCICGSPGFCISTVLPRSKHCSAELPLRAGLRHAM